MNKSFIDTTILVNVLLKRNESNKAARKAIANYRISELPVYAIKEFTYGPFRSWLWLHNKLVETKSITDTLLAAGKLFMRPNFQSTVNEAMSEVMETLSAYTNAQLQKDYGEDSTLDFIMYDKIRLETKQRIYLAWKKRRSITTNVVLPLSCFIEKNDLKDSNGSLRCLSKCKLGKNECCLADSLRHQKESLTILKEVVKNQPTKQENAKRVKVLRKLAQTKSLMDHQDCRYLGDAYFAFFAPEDSIILTTNIKDHKPLAEALSKQATTP